MISQSSDSLVSATANLIADYQNEKPEKEPERAASPRGDVANRPKRMMPTGHSPRTTAANVSTHTPTPAQTRQGPSPSRASVFVYGDVVDIAPVNFPITTPTTAISTTFRRPPINPALVDIVDTDAARNDSLRLQMKVCNPWRTLEYYKEPYRDNGQDDRAVDGEVFRIQHLPADIIYLVAKLLPPESAACLALTGKAINGVIGPRFLKLKRNHLWRFLLLLEKDQALRVACPACVRLHHYQPCRFRHWRGHKYLVNLPSSVNYSSVHQIGRTLLQGGNCNELLGLMTQRSDPGSSCALNECGVVTSSKVTPRLLDNGNLLIRCQTVVNPTCKMGITDRSMFELRGHLIMARGFWEPCRHIDWSSDNLGLRIEDQVLDSFATSHDIKHHRHPDHPFKDSHTTLCYSENEWLDTFSPDVLPARLACLLFHTQPCTKSCAKLHGKISGCRKCYSDFSITYADVPDVGRCLIFTSWKDVGGLGPKQDQKWASHATTYSGRLLRDEMPTDVDRDAQSLGDIYESFERVDVRTSPRDTHTYVPVIERDVIRALTPYDWSVSDSDSEPDSDSDSEHEGHDEDSDGNDGDEGGDHDADNTDDGEGLDCDDDLYGDDEEAEGSDESGGGSANANTEEDGLLGGFER